jgi:hypothetical protein
MRVPEVLRANYQRWSTELGVNLVQNPALAATPDIAAQIAVEWLDKGVTGVSLYNFVNPGGTDFVRARSTVNADGNSVRKGNTVTNGVAVAQIAQGFADRLSECR